MSEAEEKFRAVVRQAFTDVTMAADNLGANVVHVQDYVDAVVGSLKLDNWLIQAENIYSVRWAQPSGWDDDYSSWRVDTDGLDGYQSVWGSWEDDDE